MTPRSSCPGGESTPLQGANLRLNYEINNVTDTALGNLGAEDTIVLPVWPGPQLQTAWVTFGKQRRVNSGARRSSPGDIGCFGEIRPENIYFVASPIWQYAPASIGHYRPTAHAFSQH